MTRTNPPPETEILPVPITITTITTITIMTVEDHTIIIITEDHPQSNQEVNIIREITIIIITTTEEAIKIKEPQETNSNINNLFPMLPPL